MGRQAFEWINATHETPANDRLVLAIVSGKPLPNLGLIESYQLAVYDKQENLWEIDEFPEWTGAEVSFWCELPEPPETGSSFKEAQKIQNILCALQIIEEKQIIINEKLVTIHDFIKLLHDTRKGRETGKTVIGQKENADSAKPTNSVDEIIADSIIDEFFKKNNITPAELAEKLSNSQIGEYKTLSEELKK